MTRIAYLALLLPALIVAADASAARYVAERADGGRIMLDVTDGRLLRVRAALPARCENNHGGNWDDRLTIGLRGDRALRNGRFRINGQAPSNVRYNIRGRLQGGAISGRARLTLLDLDYVVADDSYLCDTGTRRYRASR